jgi:hypothetical protein
MAEPAEARVPATYVVPRRADVVGAPCLAAKRGEDLKGDVGLMGMGGETGRERGPQVLHGRSQAALKKE